MLAHTHIDTHGFTLTCVHHWLDSHVTQNKDNSGFALSLYIIFIPYIPNLGFFFFFIYMFIYYSMYKMTINRI